MYFSQDQFLMGLTFSSFWPSFFFVTVHSSIFCCFLSPPTWRLFSGVWKMTILASCQLHSRHLKIAFEMQLWLMECSFYCHRKVVVVTFTTNGINDVFSFRTVCISSLICLLFVSFSLFFRTWHSMWMKWKEIMRPFVKLNSFSYL